MQNNNFDISNHSYGQRVLQRSKADGISLFLYDQRDGGDVLFLHQQNTLPEAMQAYRQCLHKHDSFLQEMAHPKRKSGAAIALKMREKSLRHTPSGQSDSIYWRGLGGFGYEETASMIHSLSTNLHLVIGVQIMNRNRHLQIDRALSSMEEWLNFGRDFIIDHSMDVLRGKIKDPEHHNELQNALANATKREQQVICEVLQGHSNKEIADSLALSYYTVENHLRRIYKKFGVHSRTALIAALRA